MIDKHPPDNYTPKGYFPEDNQSNQSLRIDVTRKYFSKHYPHVNIGEISNKTIMEYLTRDYIIKLSTLEKKMDAFYDYIISQNLTDIEE